MLCMCLLAMGPGGALKSAKDRILPAVSPVVEEKAAKGAPKGSVSILDIAQLAAARSARVLQKGGA